MKILTSIKQQTSWELAVAFMKLLLYVLALLVIVVIWRGLNQEGYVIEPFKMPKNIEDSGLNGEVLAAMILDKYDWLKDKAKSSKEDSLSIGVGVSPDMNLQVMGFGFSTNSISYYLKDLLNIEVKSIAGELIDIDQQMTLTLRMTGYPTTNSQTNYSSNSKLDAIDKLVTEAAEDLLKMTDPYRLAVYKLKIKEYEEAETIIREILSSRPTDKKWAYLAWGHLKNKQEQKQLAESFYQEALSIDPNFLQANSSMGWYYYRQKEYEKAIRYFSRIKDKTGDFGRNNGLAYSYMSLGEIQKAETYMKANVDQFPDRIWSYQNYAYFLLNTKKDTIGSLNLLKKASEKLDKSADYYVSLSTQYQFQNQADSAYFYAQKGLIHDPYNVGCLQIVSQYLYQNDKERDQVIEYLNRLTEAYERGQYDAQMRMNTYNLLAMEEYKVGDYEKSLRHAQAAIELVPDNPYPYSTKAEAYALSGNQKAFYATIEEALMRGLPLKRFMDEEPYVRFKSDNRLLSLIAKYEHTVELRN